MQGHVAVGKLKDQAQPSQRGGDWNCEADKGQQNKEGFNKH